jgi:Mg2+ and Co2+ transporter CorA
VSPRSFATASTDFELIISFSSAQIALRLDQSRLIGEKFARLGLVVAMISAVVGPMSLITSYYGMNVHEFVPNTTLSLVDVWEIGMPVVIAAALFAVMTGLWVVTGHNILPKRTSQ